MPRDGAVRNRKDFAMKHFDSFGVMIDCSRNAVPSVSGLKRFFDVISKMGYNCAMLYTEDTYEIESQPYFGHLRGRYTEEELLFALKKGCLRILL